MSLFFSVNKNNSDTTFCSEFSAFVKPFSVNCDWRMSQLFDKNVNPGYLPPPRHLAFIPNQFFCPFSRWFTSSLMLVFLFQYMLSEYQEHALQSEGPLGCPWGLFALFPYHSFHAPSQANLSWETNRQKGKTKHLFQHGTHTSLYEYL